METFLCNICCCFCKFHSAQNVLLTFLENWLKQVYSLSYIVTILADLSKAYLRLLPNKTSVTKIEAIRFHVSSLKSPLKLLSFRNK